MTNNELTLDQLQAISGSGPEERQARREARQANRELKREQRHSDRQFKWGIFCDLWQNPHDEDCPYNSSDTVPAAGQCVPDEINY